MSVKILSVSPACRGTIEADGLYCYCRRRNVKDVKAAQRPFAAKEKLTIDLRPPLNEDNFTPDNPFSVYINCGAVSVESKECWDVTVINSETPNRQYKTLTVEKEDENGAKEEFEGVFRILPPKPNDLPLTLPPIQCGPPKRSVERKLTFRLVFQPELPCMVYTKIFNMWVDAVPIRLKVRGFSQGPSVCLSQNIINFGGLFLGDEVTEAVELHNHSQTTAHFQFENDNKRGVFQICPIAGTIEPMTMVKVDVTFNPWNVNSFYKRVYCLVHHQDPQYLDLIGVCVLKPIIFDGPLLLGVDSTESVLIPLPSDENDEYFGGNGFWGISLETDVLDFGFRDAVSKDKDAEVEPLTLNVTSSLPYDTKLEWTPDSTNAFVIDPPSQILPANQSISFQVKFRPGFPETFYDGNLECFVHPAENNWSEEGPPWIYTLKKKQIDEDQSFGAKEEPHPHEDADAILMTSHSVALKEGIHHHYASHAHGLVEREPSVVYVNMENKLSEAEFLASEDMEESHDSLANHEPSASHSHFYQHQHLHHEQQPQEEDDAANPPIHKARFEMQVTLQRLKEPEPVIFNVDPVGDVTYVVPIAEQESIHDSLSNKSSNKSPEEATRTIVPEMWSQNMQLDPTVSESVLRKPGKADLLEEVSGNQSGSGGDSHGIDFSTMMPSITDYGCYGGAGDGVFGLPQTLALPLCISVKVTGHTFSPSKFAGIPDVTMPSKAVMYSTLPQNPVCRSFMIKNNSDLPTYFNLDDIEGDASAYKIKPAQGLISGKCHQIILVLLNPTQPHTKVYKAKCNFKLNLQDNCQVGLFGCGEVPTLGVHILYESTAKGQEIVCAPTIPGSTSKTFIELENTSGFHYRFWLEPADWAGDLWKCITPEPANGYIAPYEKVPIGWTFAPQDELTYYVYWRFCFDVIQARSDSKTSFTDYEFIIPLTGAGRHGNLIAEPSFLDFDLVPIFEKHTKYFNLTNHGSTIFTVNLIVCHEQWLRDFSPDLITLSHRTVTLSPLKSVMVSVTVRPSQANIQNFYIIYEWSSSTPIRHNHDPNEPRVSDINSRHLVDITFLGDHVILKAMDIMLISRHPIWDAQQCFEMFSMERLNQLMIPYGNAADEGSLPEVSGVTFRFPPAPVDSEHSIFQILLSNVSNLKGYWAIETLPPKNWKKFLSQKELNANISFFDGHVKDNPDLLAKLWAKKFDTESGNETLNARSDMSLFHISHTRGCLDNKESQILTFKYNFDKVGHHKMTVLLRIYPAIFIWIDLSGRTLDVDQPHLQPMYKHHMTLHPVSVADLDPPVQMLWLYNGGNVTASFTVDQDAFEDLKENNFGHAVIECLTTTGTVRPKSWFAIKLRFSPLEYSDYSIQLKLMPDYSDVALEVLITGCTAFNTMICLRPKAHSGEVRSFIMYDHVVPVSLSPPHIAIPHFIPTGQKVSSCVFLTNLHTENYMFFRWPEVSIEGGGSITFEPDSGRIPPRGEISCMVQIQAGMVAATFSTMIRCMIEDENEKVMYNFVLSEWTKGQANGNLLDSKTNPAGTRREKRPKPEPPKPFSRLLAVSVYIGSVFGLYDSIPHKERSRMAHPDPISVIRPLPLTDTDARAKLTLSNFERQMSQEILSEMIWDMVQDPDFESLIGQLTRRHAPLYEEYKESQAVNSVNEGDGDNKKLGRQGLDQILQATVFNLIQEMSRNYLDVEGREKWAQLPPVLPQAFLDIQDYKGYMI